MATLLGYCTREEIEANRARFQMSKVRWRQRQRAFRLGLTAADMEHWYPLRENGCMICGEADKQGLCLDHDHSTGAIRGWLCHNCNLGIGNFKDSPDLLKSAIGYLHGCTADKATGLTRSIGCRTPSSEEAPHD